MAKTTHPAGDQVVLIWSTSFETDNEGFTILRAETPCGHFTPITEGMIPDVGGSGKATYTFTDGDVELRKTYYYRLQDIDSRGRITAHEVIPVTVAEAKASGESQENVSKEDNTTSDSQQTAATTGVVALHTLHNPGPSSFSVSIEDDKGNIIVVSKIEDIGGTSYQSSGFNVSKESGRERQAVGQSDRPEGLSLQITEKSGSVILTWEGRGGVRSFILHRAEKGKDNYTPITSLIPYFGRDDKDIFLYRFTDNSAKPGVKYDYRLERVEADRKPNLKIGKLSE